MLNFFRAISRHLEGRQRREAADTYIMLPAWVNFFEVTLSLYARCALYGTFSAADVRRCGKTYYAQMLGIAAKTLWWSQ